MDQGGNSVKIGETNQRPLSFPIQPHDNDIKGSLLVLSGSLIICGDLIRMYLKVEVIAHHPKLNVSLN